LTTNLPWLWGPGFTASNFFKKRTSFFFFSSSLVTYVFLVPGCFSQQHEVAARFDHRI